MNYCIYNSPCLQPTVLQWAMRQVSEACAKFEGCSSGSGGFSVECYDGGWQKSLQTPTAVTKILQQVSATQLLQVGYCDKTRDIPSQLDNERHVGPDKGSLTLARLLRSCWDHQLQLTNRSAQSYGLYGNQNCRFEMLIVIENDESQLREWKFQLWLCGLTISNCNPYQ